MLTVRPWLFKTQFTPTNNGQLVTEDWLTDLGQSETNKLTNQIKIGFNWFSSHRLAVGKPDPR